MNTAPDWHEQFLSILREDFEQRKSKNLRYSLRAFARDLGCAPASLTRLFSGQMRFSLETAIKAMDTIETPPTLRHRILIEASDDIPPLKKSEFAKSENIIADWRYLAVLVSLDCAIDQSPEALARRFLTTPIEIANIFLELERRGLIVKTNEQWLRSESTIALAGDCGADEGVRDFHRQGFVLAEKLSHAPTDRRDFSGVIFAGGRKQFETLRLETRRFLDRIAVLADGSSEKDEVYRLAIQILPLSFEENT